MATVGVDVMNMSLEEYISKFAPKKGREKNGENKFKAEWRVHNRNKDRYENDEDQFMEDAGNNDSGANEDDEKFKALQCQHEELDDDEDTSGQIDGEEEQELEHSYSTEYYKWKGPDSNTTYIDLDYTKDDLIEVENWRNTIFSPQLKQHHKHTQWDSGHGNCVFDLRAKISSNNYIKTNSLQRLQPHSPQWRIMAPNVGQRPPGMPPLIPHAAYNMPVDQQKHRNRSRKRKYRKTMHKKHNHQLDGVIVSGGSNSGRVQQRPDRNKLNKGLHNILSRNSMNKIAAQMQELQVRSPNKQLGAHHVAPQSPRMSETKAASGGELHLERGPNSNYVSDSNCILVNIDDSFKGEVVPTLATSLINLLGKSFQNETYHKPMHDFQLQKCIHELQQKPLMYHSPGGVVVSGDGIGISNFQIVPETSGISMNHRFS